MVNSESENAFIFDDKIVGREEVKSYLNGDESKTWNNDDG